MTDVTAFALREKELLDQISRLEKRTTDDLEVPRKSSIGENTVTVERLHHYS